MALHFNDPDLDRLVRLLAQKKNLSLTEVVKWAVRRAGGEPETLPIELAKAVDDMLVVLAPLKEQMTRSGLRSQHGLTIVDHGLPLPRRSQPILIEVAITWHDKGKVWLAANKKIGLSTQHPSLSRLQALLPELVSRLANQPEHLLEISNIVAPHPSGFPYDSEQDRLQWEDNKKFMDDGWEGPSGDFSKTDLIDASKVDLDRKDEK